MSIELKAPLVSVVITSYNYAKFIPDALESVAAQTYRPLECIVVDDCSTDNSAEVIDRKIHELQQKSNGITYSLVSTEKNSGQLAAFLLGIEKAKGVFINFLDADDFLFPDFISTHVQIHLESLVALTTSEPVEIDAEGQVHGFHSNSGGAYGLLEVPRNVRPVASFEKWCQNLQAYYPSAENFVTARKYIFDRYQVKWTSWLWYPTSSALFRKSALTFLGKADPEDWRICADWLLFTYANIVGNSCFIPFQLSAYRRHSRNGFALDAVTGEYRYVTREKSEMSMNFSSRVLPLSLLRIFSSCSDYFPESAEFMKTVIYEIGPKFLLKNWSKVFSYLGLPRFHQRFLILCKTIIRHRQQMKRLKR